MSTLVDGTCHGVIEACMQNALGARWQVEDVVPNTNGAMHPAARFKGSNGHDVFVKMGQRPFSWDQFVQEAWGLHYLRTHSTIKTPEVISVFRDDDKVFLVMEPIEAKLPESKADWYAMGSGLARLHQTTSTQCGLETHSYLGVFRQDNTPMDTWAGFYGERRLRESMQMAIDAGNMTTEAIRGVERLIEKLPELCDPKEPFALLHGDPWLGNLLFDGKQLVMIDCSIYYGNREIDLTTVNLFCEVPAYFFDAYHACYPIAPGYEERVALWRVNQWLGHVTLFGERYLPTLMEAVERYL